MKKEEENIKNLLRIRIEALYLAAIFFYFFAKLVACFELYMKNWICSFFCGLVGTVGNWLCFPSFILWCVQTSICPMHQALRSQSCCRLVACVTTDNQCTGSKCSLFSNFQNMFISFSLCTLHTDMGSLISVS